MRHRHVGLYSGAFDPVHAGHRAFAHAAVQEARLDEVIFLPEKKPAHKPDVTDFETRMHALEEWCREEKYLSILETPFDTFRTHTLLPYLEKQFPATRFSLLVGSDVVLGSLEHWSDLPELTRSVSFLVGMRRGDDETVVADILAHHNARYQLVKTAYAHISSTSLRRKKL